MLAVAGIRAGQVYVIVGPTAPTGSVRWRPGEPAVELDQIVHQIDPLTGTKLLRGTARGPVVETPDGERTVVAAPPTVELAPGGRRLYAIDGAEHAMWVWDVDAADADGLRISLSAERLRQPLGVPTPIGEDAEHVLVPTAGRLATHAPAFRVNLATGTLETVRLPESSRRAQTLVRPLLVG